MSAFSQCSFFGEYSLFFRDASDKALNVVPLDPTDPLAGDFSWSDTYPLGFTPRLEGHGIDFSSVFGIRGKSIAGIILNYDFSVVKKNKQSTSNHKHSTSK